MSCQVGGQIEGVPYRGAFGAEGGGGESRGCHGVSCQVSGQIKGCHIMWLLSKSRGQVGGVRFESRGRPGELLGRWASLGGAI